MIDGLLPQPLAHEIAAEFPPSGAMREQKSIREHKFTAKGLSAFAGIIEEATFAFQDPRVVALVHDITGISGMRGDPNLYAGGISLMQQGHFLLPHLDNSHDKDRQLYRVLNLLYYVTPDWKQEAGGNLELWDNGPEGAPREIASFFNRLVLMVTHKHSWHSVNRVRTQGDRACISNYYFSERPIAVHGYFHATTFRARPEQSSSVHMMLRADAAARKAVRTVFRKGIYRPEICPQAPSKRTH